MNYCRKYKDFIIGFQKSFTYDFDELLMIKYHVNDKTSVKEKLSQVNKVENIDIEYDLGNCLLLIDIENKQYSKSIEYPYSIREIDGNYITTTRINNKLYIFHSLTYDYQTGVFIFDGNKFNDKDFYLNHYNIISSYCENNIKYEYHNNFSLLHDKEIVSSCYFDNKHILINIDDDEDNKICLFNSNSYNIKVLFKTKRFRDIKIYKNYLFGLTWSNKFNIHNIENGELIKSIKNDNIKICRFFDFYDDNLVIMFDNHHNNHCVEFLKIENLLK